MRKIGFYASILLLTLIPCLWPSSPASAVICRTLVGAPRLGQGNVSASGSAGCNTLDTAVTVTLYENGRVVASNGDVGPTTVSYMCSSNAPSSFYAKATSVYGTTTSYTVALNCT